MDLIGDVMLQDLGPNKRAVLGVVSRLLGSGYLDIVRQLKDGPLWIACGGYSVCPPLMRELTELEAVVSFALHEVAPRRTPLVDPSWLTPTVIALAKGIHQESAFDRLPILADALQDAGCDNEDVLTHCRAEIPHALRCWVVDLLRSQK